MSENKIKQPNQIILENGKIENWLDIKGYEGKYQVSDNGRIWSIISNKYLTPIQLKNYRNIRLLKDNKTKTFGLNKLVLSHFKNIDLNNLVANHIDHDKNNNNINNLEPLTHSENTLAYYKFKGNEIIQYSRDKKIIKEWVDINDIIKENKDYVKVSILGAISKKITYKGFYWNYKVDRSKKKHSKIYNTELFKDEEFLPINNYKGYDLSNYWCSNYGLIFNRFTFNIMAVNFDNGYGRTTLTAKGHGDISFDVHIIVATLFCENDDPINKKCVNHKNGDKQDYCYLNLEWCTYSHNTEHAIGISIKKIDPKTRKCIEIFPSIKKAAKSIDGRPNSIKDACNVNSIYKGFYWEEK